MVLLVPCYSASSLLNEASNQHPNDLFYRVPESLMRPAYTTELKQQQPTEPIPLARNREDSPLSSSTDSISSWRSTRSAAERANERQTRRRLLDLSVAKLHGARDPPLRKHLHVYNTIKALQRDLELLDDEELLCSLTGDNSMEVDEWPRKQPSAFENIQETFGEPDPWWQTNSGSKHNNDAPVVGGSSRDDESTQQHTLSAAAWGLGPVEMMCSSQPKKPESQLWAHLDDFSANPLGHSWLSSGELSSLFAPHLHAASANGLLMQA